MELAGLGRGDRPDPGAVRPGAGGQRRGCCRAPRRAPGAGWARSTSCCAAGCCATSGSARPTFPARPRRAAGRLLRSAGQLACRFGQFPAGLPHARPVDGGPDAGLGGGIRGRPKPSPARTMSGWPEGHRSPAHRSRPGGRASGWPAAGRPCLRHNHSGLRSTPPRGRSRAPGPVTGVSFSQVRVAWPPADNTNPVVQISSASACTTSRPQHLKNQGDAQ